MIEGTTKQTEDVRRLLPGQKVISVETIDDNLGVEVVFSNGVKLRLTDFGEFEWSIEEFPVVT